MTLNAVFLAAVAAVAATSALTTRASDRDDQDIHGVEQKKTDLPGPGEVVADPTTKDGVSYVTNTLRMWGDKANVGKHPGLYISKDGGKTWRLRDCRFEFEKLFVHPDTGHLFAIIRYDSLATDPDDGTLQSCSSNKIITSTDGHKWKDITGRQGYITGLGDVFKDPDHPERVCLYGGITRPYVFQAKDEQYTDWNWLRVDRPEGKRILKKRPAPKE
jgi:hypothetical protein